MQKRIVVVDYKMGNLQSVVNAFQRLGCEARISDSKTDVLAADALVLPGVGAFGAAMQNLRNQGLIGALDQRVRRDKVPFLGICLGMQLIVEDSTESGHHEGLGWLPGHVRRLQPGDGLRVPHVGWNSVEIRRREPLFADLDDGQDFYFVHSFHVEIGETYVSGTTSYGGTTVTSMQHDNIFATQFHPEKSQINGLKLLRNFVRVVGQEQPQVARC